MDTEKTNVPVKPEDQVFHLGDFGFGGNAFMHHMRQIVESWPGTHLVIRGNHDRKHSQLMKMGFAASMDYVEITHCGYRIAMTHRPRYEIPAGVDIVLHGHVHKATYKGMVDGNEQPIIPLWNVNMCVDVTDYAPQTMEYAIRRWRRQQKS